MIILCADDYALTEGISRAVGELAAARRLSATSALVTGARWQAMAPRLVVHRAHLAVGMHFNLTLGGPLGKMPGLAPTGTFPGLAGLVARALARRLDAAEIRGELERQLDRFEAAVGFAPDHLDAHQHVHVLPVIRGALLQTAVARYALRPPLIRDPSDSLANIRARGIAKGKALGLSLLASGLARALKERGMPSNDTFAGISDFDTARPYGDELASAFLRPGRRHLIMCHPGHADAELARLDPVVARRAMEYDYLMRHPTLPEMIWRPARDRSGPVLSWLQAG
jgi:predicted glycoside hydrolase/deacetylase ChbG (UPF0249 family)